MISILDFPRTCRHEEQFRGAGPALPRLASHVAHYRNSGYPIDRSERPRSEMVLLGCSHFKTPWGVWRTDAQSLTT